MSNNAGFVLEFDRSLQSNVSTKINMNFGINTYKEQIISHQKHLLEVIR